MMNILLTSHSPVILSDIASYISLTSASKFSNINEYQEFILGVKTAGA
jgi:hypothetical protein